MADVDTSIDEIKHYTKSILVWFWKVEWGNIKGNKEDTEFYDFPQKWAWW